MPKDLAFRPLFALVMASMILVTARAQTNLPIYTDHLVNGFQDWSWSEVHNFANTNPSYIHSGTNSIAVYATNWQGVAIENSGFNSYRDGFDASLWSNFVFWANGGPLGGQRLQVYAITGGVGSASVQVPALTANTWRQEVISLSALGVDSATNISQFVFQLTASGTTNTYYLDDIQLTAKPPPAIVHVNLNASQPVRTADVRWFGFNTAIWDGNFDTTQTVSLFRELGASFLRFPGGSLSDDYHWATGTRSDGYSFDPTRFANFIHVATNVGAQAVITVNYGTGTPAEAAAWVLSANKTNQLGFKYWEVGNECYGGWETDSNSLPHDPYTYATRAQQYIQQMKAADPTIHIGVVVVPGTNNSNGYTGHPATNSITGKVSYGWTPVVLSTLKSLGVTPDFIIDHRYPEYTPANSVVCPESDALLLQCSGAWAGDAADLRQQIAGYFGPGGTNIELLCTENNSDAGSQGRQSTSLVNALYYADSLGQLMQTEINSYVWWDFRNGTDASGSFDPTLYGWRTNGDLGIVGNLTNRYPPFYAAKLMQYFAGGGDTVLGANSDYLLLSVYAARHADGAVTLLAINKDLTASLSAQIAVNGFSPGPAATIYRYGVAQDDAAQTNAAYSLQDIAMNSFTGIGTNFNYSFPPLSLTLFTLVPTAPQLAALPPQANGSGALLFSFQLQGQPNVPYVLQSSTDLKNWISVSTNTMAGASLVVTNVIPSGAIQNFWRAAWMP